MKATPYRVARDYLCLVPSECRAAWLHSRTHFAGVLFRHCTPDGNPHLGGGARFGCPLAVSCGRAVAWTGEWTERLVALRLPRDAARLSDANLYDLCAAQRGMDETIRCKRWRKEHRYSLPHAWPDDDFLTEDIDGWGD